MMRPTRRSINNGIQRLVDSQMHIAPGVGMAGHDRVGPKSH